MNDISLHILDIVQNSVTAGATLITITVKEEVAKNLLTISVKDNGCGMDAEKVAKLSDPFFTSRTTRKVGLGVPLLKHSAEQSGGGIKLHSEVGVGTYIEATFVYDNIDRPPLGPIANTVVLLVSATAEIDFLFKYYYNEAEYIFDTVEVKEALDGVPLNIPTVIKYLEELIFENMEEVKLI